MTIRQVVLPFENPRVRLYKRKISLCPALTDQRLFESLAVHCRTVRNSINSAEHATPALQDLKKLFHPIPQKVKIGNLLPKLHLNSFEETVELLGSTRLLLELTTRGGGLKCQNHDYNGGALSTFQGFPNSPNSCVTQPQGASLQQH